MLSAPVDEAPGDPCRRIGKAVSLKDIEDTFSAGLAPLLDSIQHLEIIVKDLGRGQGPSQNGCLSDDSEAFFFREKGDADSSKVTSTHFGDSVTEFRLSSNTVYEPQHPDKSKNGPVIEVESSEDSEEDSKLTMPSPTPFSHHVSQKNTSVANAFVRHVKIQRVLEGSNKESHSQYFEQALLLASWWHSIKEPPRSGRLFHIVSSRPFDSLCLLAILFNLLFMAYVADWEMKNPSEDLSQFHFTAELFFSGFFLVELILNLAVHRLYYFINNDMQRNMFDFLLVAFSILEQAVTAVMPDGNSNVGFLRVLRLMRVAKILRAFRTVRFFKDLQVVAESFKRSLLIVFWACWLLILMIFIFALVFLQSLAGYIKEGTTSVEEVYQVQQNFGSLWQTMLSLYMALTGGNDWSVYYNIVKGAGVFYAYLFLCFTFFFIFALFNILTGMIVEKAVAAATPDRNDLVLLTRKKNQEDADEIVHLCQLLDQDNDGTISRDEFATMLQDDIVASYMSSLGFDVSDVQIFFSTIAGNLDQADINIREFVEACAHLRGNATSLDMKRQLLESTMLSTNLQKVDEKNSEAVELMKTLNSKMSKLLKHKKAVREPFPETELRRSIFKL